MRLILLLLLSVGTATLAAQPDLLYYKFDETSGSLAQNNAVPGAGWQNGAISAPPIWNTTDPQVGVAALDNNGQNRRMSTGYSMDDRNGQPFTIEFWFRTTSNGYQDFCNDSDSFAIWLYNGQVQCWLGRRGNNTIPQLNGATGQNDGQWRYAALTYDGISSFNLYSGSTVGGLSAPVSATETTTFTTRAFELLHWQAASPATYSGEMDEFRLWGVELTSAQLQADRFTPYVTQDLEVFDTLGTFVKHQGVAPVTNVPGGVPTDYTFTVRNARISGNVSFTPVTLPSITGATASVISSPSTIVPGATSTFVVRVTPLQPEFTVDIDINNDRSPNPYQFTLNGMMNTGRPEMLYYRLNEGTGTLARNDASPGRGNDPSTFSTGPSWVTSGQPLGGAAAASNANLATGFNCTQLPRPEWTLETWIRRGDNGTRSICGDGVSFRIYRVNRRIWVQGGVQLVDTGYNLPNNNTTWTHLAFVSEPGSYGIRLYVNGTQQFELVNLTFPFSNAPFTVFSNGGGTNYVGALDEFRFWSHARTAAQINADLNRELVGRLEVRRPVVIANGGTDALGSVTTGVAQNLNYTLGNIGSTGLLMGNPAITFSGQTNCSVGIPTNPSGALIAASGTAASQVTVTPSAPGAFSCQLQFASNDPDTPSYVVNVSGTAVGSPQIQLERPAGSVIAHTGSDSVPGAVAGVTSNLVYTIRNTGTITLSLTGEGFSANSNCNVVLSTPLSTTLAAGATTTMQVDVTPLSAGAFSFVLHVDSNDPATPTYDINVGDNAAPGGEIDIQRPAGAGNSIADGGTNNVTGAVAGVQSILTFTVENLGTGDLTLTTPNPVGGSAPSNCGVILIQPGLNVLTPTGANSSTTFQVRITPIAAGTFSYQLTVASDDANEDPYNININGSAAPGGEINVERPVGTSIADGGTDAVGSSFVAGMGTVLTYRVLNLGSAALNISGTSLTAQTNCGAVVTSALPGSIANGGFADLQITVTPAASGAFSFDIDINSDDVDENPYDIHVAGTSAPGGEIHIERPVGTGLADGATDNVGTSFVAGVGTILTYRVFNQGTAGLSITGISITGQSNCAAVVTGALPGSINAGSFADLQVTVTPSASGAFGFDIDINNDDVNENPYDIHVDGTSAPGGEIHVERPVGTGIADGATDNVGGSFVAGVSSVLTYRVFNQGTATLSITGVSLTGQTNCGAVVTTALPASIANGAFADLQITVTPAALGAFSFDIDIDSDDVDESTYDIHADGSAASGGEIDVQQPASTSIPNSGSQTVNGTVAGATTQLTYTVENTGTGDLTITGTGTTGALNNVGVVVGTVGSTVLSTSGPSSTTTFTVDITPSALGAWSYTLLVTSNDTSDPSYTIAVDGNAAPGGEIDVQQPAPTSIANGGSQTVNGTVAGATTQLIYTVENTGTGDLTITGTGTTGALNNVGVIVGTVGSTVLGTSGPGSTTTFTVDITPTALGTWSFTLQVTSNDTTDPSYTIAVDGNAAAGGEIELQRPALSPIANGGSDNVAGTVAGATTQVTYTVENTGTGDLTITGTGTTGALNNVGVVVGTVGSTVLSTSGPGSTTTFTVDITPTAHGVWSFTLQITSNDTTDPSYTINVSDTAVPGGEIHVERPVSTNIFDGGTDSTGNSHVAGVGTVLTYTVRNLGTAVMTLSGVAISNETNCAVVVTGALPGSINNGNSAQLQLTVTPVASGSFSFDFDINSDDQDENPYDIHVDGSAAPGGEIDIQQPAPTSIANGGSQTVNGTVAGATTQLTYTVENQGTGDLTISGTGTTGALNNVGVTVGTVGSTVLSTSGPGSTTTFTVDITPTALGAWSFVLRVSNDDANENPYDIDVSGTAAPGGEIQVERPVSTVIPDGAPDSLTGTHVAGIGTVLNYTVRNLGTADLTITGTAFSNETNCAAVVTGALPGVIANGASAVFQVTVTPNAAGAFSFDLDINSNDIDENPYDIAIDGTALAGGEINLQRPGGTTILHNGSDSVTGAVAGASTSLFYTIQNLGTADLTISGQSFNTNNNCNVTVFAPVVNPIASSSSTTLQVDVTALSAGAFDFVLQIDSDDVSEPNYIINVGGSAAVGGEIHVERPVSTNIFDGGTDNTGSSHVAGVGSALDYTVRNLGTATLTITGVAISNLSNCNAVVTGALPASIGNGSSSVLQITVTPTASGSFSFDLDINSDDLDEATYDIHVDGSAAPGGEIELQRPAASPIANGGTDSVPGTVAGATTQITYTIENQGTGNLTISGTGTTGAQNNVGVVVGTVGSTVLSTSGAGSVTTFIVDITPTSLGAWSFTLQITSDDTSDPSYTVSVSDTAAAGGEIDVQQPAPTSIVNGGSQTVNGTVAGITTQLTYTVENQGTGDLTITGTGTTGALNNVGVVVGTVGSTVLTPTGAGSTTTFTVDITPTALGTWSFTLEVTSNDTTDPSYTITVDGNAAPGGEIDVQQPAPTSIVNGGSQTVNGTVAGATTQLIYTVENTGTGDLTITGTGTAGALNNVGVVVGTVGSTMLTPTGAGSTTTFTVDITPAAFGAWSFTLEVTSNDTTDPSYTINVDGTSAAGGEIDIQRPVGAANSIPDNIGSDSVSGTIAGVTTIVTYTIENQGTATLTLTGQNFNAANNCNVVVGVPGATSLNPSQTTTLQVQVTPIAGGAWDFELVVTSNDVDESTYNFTVAGTATYREIHVDYNSSPLSNPDTVIVSPSYNGVMANVAFELRNAGNELVNLTGTPDRVNVISSSNVSATPIQPVGSTVAAAAVVPFSVDFTPTAAAAWNFVLQIDSDDPANPVWTITVSGTSFVTPVLDFTPTVSYGNHNIGTTSAALSHALTNIGGSNLVITSISLIGADAARWSLINNPFPGPPQVNVLPAGSIPLQGQYTPNALTSHIAQIEIISNTGGVPGTISLIDIDGNGTFGDLSSPSPVNYPSVNLGASGTPVTHTLTSSGTGPVRILNITKSGADQADWALGSTPSYPQPLTSGAFWDITGTFTPSHVGGHSAQFVVDWDEGAGTTAQQTVISVSGTGTVGSSVTNVSTGADTGGPVFIQADVNATGASFVDVAVTYSGGSNPGAATIVPQVGLTIVGNVIQNVPANTQLSFYWDAFATEGNTTAANYVITLSPTVGATPGTPGSSPVFGLDRTTDWTKYGGVSTQAAIVQPVSEAAMVHDTVNDRLVVFGGERANSLTNDVWTFEFASNSWRRITPTGTLPTPRRLSPHTYDSVNNRMIVFGGETNTGVVNDTWALDLTTGVESWTSIAGAAPLPEVRTDGTLVMDAANQRAILYGGYNAGKILDDTWILDLTPGSENWGAGALTTTGTPAGGSIAHCSVFDPINGEMYVFRALDAQIWKLDFSATPAWTNLTIIGGPTARRYPTAVYDPVAHAVVIHGGRNYVSPMASLNDTWSYDIALGTWSQLPSEPNSGGRYWHSAVYDNTRQQMVVLGGRNSDNEKNNRIGVLKLTAPVAWQTPPDARPVSAGLPPRSGAVICNDFNNNRIVMFGGRTDGNVLSDLWMLDRSGSGTWVPLAANGPSPSARAFAAHTFDFANNRLILFGGEGAGGNMNDVWVLDLPIAGTPTWSFVIGNSGPSQRRFASAAYDSSRNNLMIYGGDDGTILGDVWSLNLAAPVWNQLAPGGVPPVNRRGHGSVYDSFHDRLVVFCGDSGGVRNDVWAMSLGGSPNWTDISSGQPTLPIQRWRFSSSPSSDGRNVYMGCGDLNGSLLGDFWHLDLTGVTAAWSRLGTFLLHTGRIDPVGALDNAGKLVFGTGGYNYKYTKDTYEIDLGAPSLVPIAFTDKPVNLTYSQTAFDLVGRRMIAYGGVIDGAPSGGLWQLDLNSVSPTWSPLAATGQSPGPLMGASFVYDGSSSPPRMLLYGGRASALPGSSKLDLWALELDPGNEQWVKLNPTVVNNPYDRFLHTAVIDGAGHMLVMGGRNFWQNRLNDVYQLDLATLTWTVVSASGTPPTIREAHSAIYDGLGGRNRMIVHGGTDGFTYFNDTWELDLNTMTWSQLTTGGPTPAGTEFHTTVLDPDTGRMLLYGGSNPAATDQFFSLDLATDTWTQISPAGPAPQSRWGHACIWDSVAHRLVLVGGYTGDNNPAYRAELTQDGGAEVDTWFWRG